MLLLALLLALRPFTPDELLQTRRPGDVQVSPDGRWASVTVRQKNLDTNHDDGDIWLLPLPSGPARQFTRNGHSEHARWSPDGKQLLVVRDGRGDDFQFTPEGELIVSSKPAQREAWSTNGDLWLIDRSGSAPKNLTPQNHGDDAQPRPSPDGKYLAWSAQARDGYESDLWK